MGPFPDTSFLPVLQTNNFFLCSTDTFFQATNNIRKQKNSEKPSSQISHQTPKRFSPTAMQTDCYLCPRRNGLHQGKAAANMPTRARGSRKAPKATRHRPDGLTIYWDLHTSPGLGIHCSANGNAVDGKPCVSSWKPFWKPMENLARSSLRRFHSFYKSRYKDFPISFSYFCPTLYASGM